MIQSVKELKINNNNLNLLLYDYTTWENLTHYKKFHTVHVSIWISSASTCSKCSNCEHFELYRENIQIQVI